MKTPWISRKQHERELARLADHCVDLELEIARVRRERDRARAQVSSLKKVLQWRDNGSTGSDDPPLGESPPLEDNCTCPPGWQHRTPDCPFSTGSHTPGPRYG